jgi:hypothetical protein
MFAFGTKRHPKKLMFVLFGGLVGLEPTTKGL